MAEPPNPIELKRYFEKRQDRSITSNALIDKDKPGRSAPFGFSPFISRGGTAFRSTSLFPDFGADGICIPRGAEDSFKVSFTWTKVMQESVTLVVFVSWSWSSLVEKTRMI